VKRKSIHFPQSKTKRKAKNKGGGLDSRGSTPERIKMLGEARLSAREDTTRVYKQSADGKEGRR